MLLAIMERSITTILVCFDLYVVLKQHWGALAQRMLLWTRLETTDIES